MNRALLKAIKPIEDDFDILLITEEEALGFVKDDLASIEESFRKEIEWIKSHHDYTPIEYYLRGLEQGLNIVREHLQIRIDEGY